MQKTSGRYFRRWMRSLDLSYEQVAEDLEVHPVTVRNWEKHGAKRLVKLAFDNLYRPYKRPEWRHLKRRTRARLGP